jgi:hypothetical protein
MAVYTLINDDMNRALGWPDAPTRAPTLIRFRVTLLVADPEIGRGMVNIRRLENLQATSIYNIYDKEYLVCFDIRNEIVYVFNSNF